MFANVVFTLLETAINHYLHLDPDSIRRTAAFSGKVVAIKETHLQITCYLCFKTDGIRLQHDYAGQADTVLSGPIFALLRLAQSQTTGLPVGITIEGDIDLGQQVQAILRNVDVDWEEQLSHVTGDVIAHQIGNCLRQFSHWAQTTGQSLQQNITEYLQEETRHLPTRIELEDFLQAVDSLRDDVERAEVRWLKLIRV